MAVDYFGYFGITKGINLMTNKWNDKSWQKDFLNMKSHSPADAKLLMGGVKGCLLYTSPSPRDTDKSRMPSSA